MFHPASIRGCAAIVSLSVAAVALAEVPAPANDTSATAETLGPVPAVTVGSNVQGSDTLSATTLGGLASVPGPDVFYRFTPATAGDYWITMIPWVEVPVYGSSGGTVPVPNLCVYLRRVSDGVFLAGSDANPRGRSETAIATLAAGVEYEIVVDSTETVARGQAFEFTLIVAAAPSGAGDDCLDLGSVPGGLPTAIVDTLSGAANDFDLTETPGICDVAFTPIVPGADRVYSFTTGPDPNDAGDYVFSLVPGGASWDGVVYIADSCPPFLLLGCLGAANHTSSATRQSETIVATLEFDTEYFVVVDANTFSLSDPKFALLVDRADAWDLTEIEVNDTPAMAASLAPGTNGGQLAGPEDVDYWAVSALGGEKLYAFLDNGNVTLSGLDVELRLFDTDGVGLIELDDDDGEGSDSDLASFIRRASSFSAVIAGATLPAAGTYYLEVSNDLASTIARYRLHVGIQPAGRLPSPECDRNDTPDLADFSAKDWFAGVIATQGDVDTYAFDALAGERVFLALDGDPERDSGGDDADDPLALDAALVVIDPDGDVLLSDHDDVNAIGSGQQPDYAAEGLTFVAPLSGTYHVQVAGGDPATDFGAGRTYELAIFRDSATPVLGEDLDPVIDSLTPDFMNDSIAAVASDDAGGDSGICDVQLAAGSTNLALSGLSFTPGDPTVSFTIELATPGLSGSGKLVIVDCAGNTACAAIDIDAGTPICSGSVVTPGTRTFESRHDPIHAPDNQPSGPGIEGTLDIDLPGTIADVNVTVTAEGSRVPDIDVFLESPTGTRVDVFSDIGSSSAFSVTDATFDDAAADTISILDDEPYTGTWLPDDALGLAQFNGESVTGTWRLNLRDDASTSSGGSRLVRWSLEIDAGFANPQEYQGNASDSGGIQSIELVDPNNVLLTVDPFTPGDASVDFTITLINPAASGAATVLVTDISDNTCSTPVTLAGLPDTKGPESQGAATRDLVFGGEAQLSVPPATPGGVTSSFNVPESVTVGSVLVELTINTLDVGRLAATLSHNGQLASLINRVGMDERGSVGLTKDNLELLLDDDAPEADDAHLETPLGSSEFLGLYQPDGRGAFIGDGIDADDRDNMLFAFEGGDSAGDWDLFVGDFRIQGGGIRSEFRRWKATVIAPGAPERYVGVARDGFPESGICSVALAAGATNLVVDASFTPPAAEVSYVVSLSDPNLPGSGTLEITDCAGNVTSVPISLAAQLADQNLPVAGGVVNIEKFEGTASDNAPGDSGIVSIELAPWSDNLEIVELDPLPAGSATFTVARIDDMANARGYVRVTDAAGFRRHVLIDIDASAPVCTSTLDTSRRYFSGPVNAPLPDASGAGATADIVVPDFDVIDDVDLTINITHPFDDDIDLRLIAPSVLSLFSDIGSTGNDFRDTTLDDEAASPIPDSFGEAPFTGSYQPEPPATLSVLDGAIAAGTYTLQAIDDASFNLGTLDNWSLRITSATFPQQYDGRAEDGGTHDLGICSVVLVGDSNLTLTVDPAFVAGDAIVRYTVELTNEALDGSGTVRVTDCAGNICEESICLVAASPPATPGDLDGDGDIDFDDFGLLNGCLLGPEIDADADVCGPCRLADFDGDGDVDLDDVLAFQLSFDG